MGVHPFPDRREIQSHHIDNNDLNFILDMCHHQSSPLPVLPPQGGRNLLINFCGDTYLRAAEP